MLTRENRSFVAGAAVAVAIGIALLITFALGVQAGYRTADSRPSPVIPDGEPDTSGTLRRRIEKLEVRVESLERGRRGDTGQSGDKAPPLIDKKPIGATPGVWKLNEA